MVVKGTFSQARFALCFVYSLAVIKDVGGVCYKMYIAKCVDQNCLFLNNPACFGWYLLLFTASLA